MSDERLIVYSVICGCALIIGGTLQAPIFIMLPLGVVGITLGYMMLRGLHRLTREDKGGDSYDG